MSMLKLLIVELYGNIEVISILIKKIKKLKLKNLIENMKILDKTLINDQIINNINIKLTILKEIIYK